MNRKGILLKGWFVGVTPSFPAENPVSNPEDGSGPSHTLCPLALFFTSLPAKDTPKNHHLCKRGPLLTWKQIGCPWKPAFLKGTLVSYRVSGGVGLVFCFVVSRLPGGLVLLSFWKFPRFPFGARLTL